MILTEDEESLLPYLPPVERCKIEIEYNARRAGLRFDKSDIIVIEENGFGTIVFLSKFNPENIIDKQGIPQIFYHTAIHALCPSELRYNNLYPRPEEPISTYLHTRVQIVCTCPWLVRIIDTYGTIIRHEVCLQSAFHNFHFSETEK